MKVIDLLNKIAKGEEIPKKIKYDGMIFDYQGSDWLCKKNGWWFITSDDKILENLNDELEIIEEEKEIEKLEKLSIRWKDSDVIIDGSIMSEDIEEVLANKINELIDVINDMRDKE